MANQEHLKILKQGVEAWNKWRKKNPKIKPELRAADLIGTKLSGADLSRASLSGASLSGANLSGADLTEAYLGGANLYSASLSRASLKGADLSGAYLNDAKLSRADLFGAKLSRTDFSRAKLLETHFAKTNLINAKNLDECYHLGPSTIDQRTFERSGNLPNKFLRGCGLNDWQIEATKLYNPKLRPNQIMDIQQRVFELRSGKPIQTTNLFISYSHADKKFVEHLEDYLEDRRVLYWRDVHDAPAGPLEEIVIRAMRHNPAVLLILSHHSVESDWVEYEAKKARELEKESGRHVLCPVALDESWKTCNWEEKLRMQIQKYNILDFSDWQNDDNFEAKFNRLLEGLKLYYKPED
jgi:hypothetical protein